MAVDPDVCAVINACLKGLASGRRHTLVKPGVSPACICAAEVARLPAGMTRHGQIVIKDAQNPLRVFRFTDIRAAVSGRSTRLHGGDFFIRPGINMGRACQVEQREYEKRGEDEQHGRVQYTHSIFMR